MSEIIYQFRKFATKDKFTYEITAEPETLHCQTIKLIVQPLVENANYHGMEFMDGDGEIYIRAYRKDGDLYIDVVDNGLGMPQEQADALLTKDTGKVRGKGSGIGLKNVQERIQLYFGPDYGLSCTVNRMRELRPESIFLPNKGKELAQRPETIWEAFDE